LETTEIKEDVEQKGLTYHFLGTRSERIFFIILLTFLSAAPIIFGKGIPSHADWHIHIEHAYNFKRCFWQGQWFPRWIDAQVNGYGLPIFNYYAPLVYYLFVALDLIFKNVILSIKGAFIIPMVLCSVFGYLYLRRHGSPASSTIALAFIIFSPAIHIFIYNTNWPTSTLALAFLFLALYGIDIFDKNKDFDLKSFLLTSAGYALMAVSHLATAFVFTLIAVPYCLLSLYLYRTKKFVKNIFLSFAMGASLAGFYLFPACMEKKLVHTDEVLTKAPLWDFSKNFLFTYLDRNKDEGYAWAIFDHRYYEVSNALFGLAVLICIAMLVLNMEKIKQYFNEPFRVNIAITMFVISFLMMTPLSIFVWLMIKPMQTIQFPWRFTTFILPFGAAIMVYAFDLAGHLAKEKVNLSGYKFLFNSIALVFACLVYVDFINMYHWKWVPEQSLSKAAQYVLWPNEEYRPNTTNDPNWKEIDFKRDFSPSIYSSDPLSDITLIKWFSHERIFEVFSQGEHFIRLRNLYFPGWSVYIDEKSTKFNMDQKVGLITFSVPPGKHQIRVSFEPTPLRKGSAYISIIALVIYFLMLSNLFQGRHKVLENTDKKKEEENAVEANPPVEVLIS